MLSPDQARAAAAEVARGNPDAFRPVVRAYAPAVRAYLAAHVYRMDEVDDLAQEVFLAAYREMAAGGRVADLGAWLRGVARNKMLAHARAAARRADALDRFRAEAARVAADDLEELAAADRADTLDQLLRCVAGLPDRLRVVVRAGLDGIKPDALAADLGVSVGTVYNLNCQAHKRLRECLRRRGAV
jgi:RNA polymerase sigma-70 factor (ECF subfamily)